MLITFARTYRQATGTKARNFYDLLTAPIVPLPGLGGCPTYMTAIQGDVKRTDAYRQ